MKILVVDDDPIDLRVQEILLKKQGYQIETSPSGADAIEKVKRSALSYSLIILDYRMQDLDGARTAEELLKLNRELMILIHSGDESQVAVLSSWEAGAVTFVRKSNNTEAFLEAVKRWVEEYKRKFACLEADAPTECEELISEIGMVGRSSELASIAGLIKSDTFRRSDSNVLIVGENGTGKELVARAIHANSKRKNGLFVAVNCAALTPSLIESELFGHVKGSFTGATHDKVGLFEQANRGTIFLDEIGETPLSFQVKLLRVVQMHVFRKVGGREEIKSDFRVISATNRDLEKEKELGRFREDLYHRLSVVNIEVPPLRHRPEDVAALVLHLTNAYNKKEAQKKRFRVEAVDLLSRYAWPGNVRELENIIEKLLYHPIDEKSEIISSEDFGEALLSKIKGNQYASPLREQIYALSRDAVLEAIRTTPSKREAAKKLAMPWTSFRRLMRRLGIDSTSEEAAQG